MRNSNKRPAHNRSITEWKALVERYFEADTSKEEEAELRSFLTLPEATGKEFDEARAVLSFLAVGRELSEKKSATVSLRSHRRIWNIAASLLIGLAIGCSWLVTHQRNNQCIAYIHGEKITNSEIVLQQMKLSFQEIQVDSEKLDVKNQLNEIFDTLTAEEVSEEQL